MSKNLYVGNLPFGTTDEDLRQAFAQYGTVIKAQVIMDRETGRSRGFGFVEMSSSTEAGQAIETLNGRDVGGRQINVNEAKPREGGSNGGRPRSGGGGGYSRRSY